MLYCTFYNKLRRLNPRIRVYGDDTAPARPWGIYVVDRDGLGQQHLCGINPIGGMVYELTERRWDGYILRQGWRRVLNILVSKNVIDEKRAEREFGTAIRERTKRGLVIEDDPLTRATAEAKARGFAKTGVEGYMDTDDIISIHRWREKLRENKQNYWA